MRCRFPRIRSTTMLTDEGKIDFNKPMPTYVPELRGTHWEQATVKNVMNMSSGLDIEKNMVNLMNQNSWIAKWFSAVFEAKGSWREMSQKAVPLKGESAGDHFRYSGANTQTLVLATQYVNGLDSTEHDEELQDTRTNPERGYFKWAVTLGFLINPDQKEKDPLEVLRSMKRKYPGHTAFEYNSINTFVMNRINERIGGKSIIELFSEMVWSKIGAEHDMVVAVSPRGYPMSFGWNASTLRDMARFGMIFTPSWNKVSSERIVPNPSSRCSRPPAIPKSMTRDTSGKP